MLKASPFLFHREGFDIKDITMFGLSLSDRKQYPARVLATVEYFL